MADVRFCCFLSSSKRSLFDVTKAISIPEKNAEKSSVINIKVIISKMSVHIFGCKYTNYLATMMKFSSKKQQ